MMDFTECVVERVLLIDDDKATNFFNKMMVSRHMGFEYVDAVQGGQEALTLLSTSKNKPNLIFLDINMPGMNGWEFLTAFENLDDKITNGIKIILLSTSSNPDEVMKSINDFSVDDYINKPLSASLLNEVLEKHFSH
tara:strand:+ start:98968 stop:99378 length:411 start_codon:yes stop_codon:yes gene_type:complete